jgi:hypothetical protein
MTVDGRFAVGSQRSSVVGLGSKFIFLEGFEGRRAGAQGIVLGNAVEDVDAAIVKQSWLRDGAPRGGRANCAALERPIGDFLQGFEAMPLDALIFV